MIDFFKDHPRPRTPTHEMFLPSTLTTIRNIPTTINPSSRSPLLEPITPLPLAHHAERYACRIQVDRRDRSRHRDQALDVLPRYNSDTLPKYDDVVQRPRSLAADSSPSASTSPHEPSLDTLTHTESSPPFAFTPNHARHSPGDLPPYPVPPASPSEVRH